jgi:hypothetical protein
LVFSQQEYSSARQARQAPQAIGKGTTTRSPTRKPRPVDAGADLDDLAHELVAQNVAGLHRRHVTVEQVEVGPADGRRRDLHDGVAAVEDRRVRDPWYRTGPLAAAASRTS